MQHTHHALSEAMQTCIDRCDRCHDFCMTTVTHCLSMGGEHASPAHITLLLDCAQICHTSADFMLRGSQMHKLMCSVCAEVCIRCAEDCERLASGDRQMLDCAQMCRDCARSCREMAA